MRAALRVLIVEDEWLIAQDTASSLRHSGHHIVGPTSSVASALQLIDKDRIDAALLDIQLNGETSLPLAQELQARGIPFAFITGYGQLDVPPEFRSHEFLQKPASSVEILAALQGLVTK